MEWNEAILSLMKRSMNKMGKPGDHRTKIAFLSKDSCEDMDATKPDDLDLIPTTHVVKKKTNSHNLSSGLQFVLSSELHICVTPCS